MYNAGYLQPDQSSGNAWVQLKAGGAAARQLPGALAVPFKAFGRKSLQLHAFLNNKEVQQVRTRCPKTTLLHATPFPVQVAVLCQGGPGTPCSRAV